MGPLDETVFVVGNEPNDWSLNPGPGCLPFI